MNNRLVISTCSSHQIEKVPMYVPVYMKYRWKNNYKFPIATSKLLQLEVEQIKTKADMYEDSSTNRFGSIILHVFSWF